MVITAVTFLINYMLIDFQNLKIRFLHEIFRHSSVTDCDRTSKTKI